MRSQQQIYSLTRHHVRTHTRSAPTIASPGRHCRLLILLTTGSLLVSGCQQDTRMNVYEYLEMQKSEHGVLGEEARAALAATQPAAEPPAPPALPELDPWAQGPYRVGPEDVLTVTIPGMDALGLPSVHTVRVSQEGIIRLPSIDDVHVSGKALDEIEPAIEDMYKASIRDPQVRVEISQYHMLNVMVVGDVTQPATVELRRDRMSVLHAMLAAGGPMEFAGRVTIVPAKDPDAPVRLDLSYPSDLARAAKAGVIDDGDVMIVDRRPHSAVYVLGLVNNPGPVLLPRASSLSVLQALGSAGGTRLEFEPKDATVLRRNPDGTVLRVKLHLQRTLNGEDPDIRLAAGDILVVPHTADTRLEEFLARNLRMGYGVETTFNPWTHYYFKRDQDLRGGGFGGSLFDSAARQLFFGSDLFGVAAPPPGTP